MSYNEFYNYSAEIWRESGRFAAVSLGGVKSMTESNEPLSGELFSKQRLSLATANERWQGVTGRLLTDET